MSIDKETIAKYYQVKPEEVRCAKCEYGKGEFLVECSIWSRIMGEGEFCSFWTDGSLHGTELNCPKVLEDRIVEKLKEEYLEPKEEKPVDAILHLLDREERRKP